MSRWALAGAAAAALLAWAPAAPACPVPSSASPTEVQRALRAGTDVWGNRLLRAAGGPTLAAARRFLPPLRFARAHGGAPLTASGVYYVPLAGEPGPQGASELGLHVADGGRIYAGSVSGPSLAVFVDGRPFASCRSELEDWDQAPADGRLAAAMATNWANRRPMRPGALASSLRTFAIARFPCGAGTTGHTRKMMSLG